MKKLSKSPKVTQLVRDQPRFGDSSLVQSFLSHWTSPLFASENYCGIHLLWIVWGMLHVSVEMTPKFLITNL